MREIRSRLEITASATNCHLDILKGAYAPSEMQDPPVGKGVCEKLGKVNRRRSLLSL